MAFFSTVSLPSPALICCSLLLLLHLLILTFCWILFFASVQKVRSTFVIVCFLFFENPAKKRWHTSATNRGCNSMKEHGRHVARHHPRRRAYAPTSNTASHDNHEKINSCVSFNFHIWDAYGAPLVGSSGCRSSTNITSAALSLQFKKYLFSKYM